MELIFSIISLVLFALLYALLELVKVLKKQTNFFNQQNQVEGLMQKLNGAIDGISIVQKEIKKIKDDKGQLGLE